MAINRLLPAFRVPETTVNVTDDDGVDVNLDVQPVTLVNNRFGRVGVDVDQDLLPPDTACYFDATSPNTGQWNNYCRHLLPYNGKWYIPYPHWDVRSRSGDRVSWSYDLMSFSINATLDHDSRRQVKFEVAQDGDSRLVSLAGAYPGIKASLTRNFGDLTLETFYHVNLVTSNRLGFDADQWVFMETHPYLAWNYSRSLLPAADRLLPLFILVVFRDLSQRFRIGFASSVYFAAGSASIELIEGAFTGLVFDDSTRSIELVGWKYPSWADLTSHYGIRPYPRGHYIDMETL